MTYRFEDFELDTDRFELRKQGVQRPIEPQVFALLRLLVENCHRMVPRDEIVETIWAGRVVSEAALSSRIKSARQSLEDDGARQRLIRTVHGQGFRFVGTVIPVGGPEAIAAEPATAEAWSRDVLARPIIAVLPFESEGDAPEDAYFINGIAEQMILELTYWRWFPILSRNSSFVRNHASLPASVRAGALGARYALTGQLLRTGGRATLAVELIDAATDTQLWAAHYGCESAVLGGLQKEIAASVFRKIAPELTSAETRRIMRKPVDSLTAWDMALKGLWHLRRANPQDFAEALGLLEEATRLDRGFALPWSFIALARFEQALQRWTGGDHAAIQDALREMLAAANTGLELDPTCWMAHALVSAGELWANASFSKARLHADRAIELNPSGSLGYHFSGCIHGFAGDLDTAIATQGIVYRVDPAYDHADLVEADLGLWCLLAGDFDGAAEHLERAISINPSNVRARQQQVALAGCSGNTALAESAVGHLRAMGGVMNERQLAASYPFRDARHATAFRNGLVEAGLLEV